MISGGSHYPKNDISLHPLVLVYEERLCSLIGVISKFIVEKKFTETMETNNGDLDLDAALEMSKGILDEVSILVGPVRTKKLTVELEEITKVYFEEESKDE